MKPQKVKLDLPKDDCKIDTLHFCVAKKKVLEDRNSVGSSVK